MRIWIGYLRIYDTIRYSEVTAKTSFVKFGFNIWVYNRAVEVFFYTGTDLRTFCPLSVASSWYFSNRNFCEVFVCTGQFDVMA